MRGRFKLVLIICGATSLIAVNQTALAATNLFSYTFDAPVFGDASNRFTGSLTIADEAGTYSLVSLSAQYRSGIFNLSNSGLATTTQGRVVIGGLSNGITGISTGANDFLVNFNPATGFVLRSSVVSPETDINDLDLTLVRVPSTPAGVPEPATWAMLVAGFSLIGSALRRHKGTISASPDPLSLEQYAAFEDGRSPA